MNYDNLIYLGYGVIYAVKNAKAGLIHKSGKIIVDCIYDDIYEKTTHLDYDEDERLDFEFFSVSKKLYTMSLNGKKGVKNYNGKTILDFEYDRIRIFPNNNILAIKDEQYAIFNSNGSAVIDFGEYDKIDMINYNNFKIKKDDNYGCINIKDNWIIKPQYKKCLDANSKFGLIKFENKEGKQGIVDKDNNIVINFEYDWLNIVQHSKYIQAQMGSKYGIFDIQGNVIAPCKYSNDELEIYDDFILIKKILKRENSLITA